MGAKPSEGFSPTLPLPTHFHFRPQRHASRAVFLRLSSWVLAPPGRGDFAGDLSTALRTQVLGSAFASRLATKTCEFHLRPPNRSSRRYDSVFCAKVPCAQSPLPSARRLRAAALASPAFRAICSRFAFGIFFRASAAALLALMAISLRLSGDNLAARIRASAAAGFSDFAII